MNVPPLCKPLEVWNRRSQSLPLLVLLAAIGVAVDRANASEPQSSESIERRALPMMFDPELPRPAPEIQFDRRNVTLWLAALQRSEFDGRMEAIEAFTEAHRQGVKDLSEALLPIEKLLMSDPHADVRLAAARALIAFDHRPAAAALQRAVATDSNPPAELVLAVDAALARWNHVDAIPMWIARLNQCADRPTAGISAMRSLAIAGARQAGEPIAACVRDRKLSPAVRLEAARALPRVSTASRSDLAADLASEPGQWGPLLALLALGSGQIDPRIPALDTTGLALVESLVSHPDARVRSHAVELLRRADAPRAVVKSDLLRDSDDQVRLEAVLTLALAPMNASVIESLAAAMNDASEPVRVAARAGLRDAWDKHSLAVQPLIARALSGGRWRETEQAAILAGELNAVAAAEQLASLLEAERAEVRLAASTSLRQLNLKESLPALFARAEVLTAAASESANVPERLNAEAQELAQIFMAFAQQRHAAAAELLKKYIPKRTRFHPLARGAAIYALGKIFEAKPTPALATQLLARAEDNNPVDPEAADVRRFAVIALGRMGALETLPALYELYEAENSTVSVGGASRWSIMHLKAIELPPCKPVVKKAGPFFLESISPAPRPGQP